MFTVSIRKVRTRDSKIKARNQDHENGLPWISSRISIHQNCFISKLLSLTPNFLNPHTLTDMFSIKWFLRLEVQPAQSKILLGHLGASPGTYRTWASNLVQNNLPICMQILSNIMNKDKLNWTKIIPRKKGQPTHLSRAGMAWGFVHVCACSDSGVEWEDSRL